ncbi:MAG: homogentisate 1,2-dioxygenase [Candidatus Thermoplasmatota archaeon]|nr:homogentisate 1,2-dioxygenase [Candidatus Thermoplasmatota archaeon]
MPPYMQIGQVPPKRHTQFRKEDGSLYREEVFGTEGFEGVESILYHEHEPTKVSKLKGSREMGTKAWRPKQHRHHHLRLGKVDAGGDFVEARRPVATSEECTLSVIKPTEGMTGFFRNATADELFFVKQGEGHFETVFGKLPYRAGDYVHMPRGTTYRLPGGDGQTFLLIESPGPITFPDKYLNKYGQFLEHSPYCERDLHGPTELIQSDEEGPFEIHVKTWDEVSVLEVPHSPLDVVGWDGYNYPFTFNIEDFEPITGRIHQPPPVHATFVGPGFEVISWVPRKLDYHPKSIPAPYYHANIDTDELIYYVEGNFTSRKGVDSESLTIHRRGLHHGPQPGRYEGSIGVEEAHETAVMIEAESHFELTEHAKGVDEADYMMSWTE